MSNRWAVRLDPRDRTAIASLRLMPEIEVCADGSAIWLAGSGPDEALNAVLYALPGERFTVGDNRQLIAVGARVPRGYLPEGPWTPLRSWLTIELPATRLAGQFNARVALRLVRGGVPAEANVLVTTLDAWRAYASAAPQVRLKGLVFAATEQQVVVQGTPLPPIRGTRFVAREGVATPAGWTWTPAVDASVVRVVLRLAAGDLALWHAEGAWSHVRSDDFVRATRSAARLSPQGARDV